MDLRTAYTRRLEKASRRQKRIGALAVFGVTAGVAALLIPELAASHDEDHVSSSAGLALAAAPVFGAGAVPGEGAAAPRRVYPYSIVPGGVSGAAELKRVIRADRVVAAHYASFDAGKAREVIVTKPRAVHVSYRKGDQVFWTAKKVMLAQGETLLSDGTNEMRARCANRISDVPRFPVEAHGPSEEELDTVLAGATGEQGMFLAASAGLDPDEGGSGSRYPLGYFPNGAGLVQPASALASMRSAMPSVPRADRSALYGVGSGSLARMAQGSASEDDAAAPGSGSSGSGSTGSGSGEDTVQAPGDGTPATGGADTPSDGDPSTVPGSGDPATPGTGNGDTGGNGNPGGPATGGNGGTGTGGSGNGGTGTGGNGNGGNGGGGGGGTGSGEQPSTPAPTPIPETGPGLPPQTPDTPGAPPTPGDVELPAAPTEVPEPGTLWLASAAMAAMLWLRRKGSRAQH